MDTDFLGGTALAAIRAYAKMAARLPAPESFLRDACAIRIHEDLKQKVSVELPIRTFVNEWNMERLEFEGLGTFRIDLAVFSELNAFNKINLNNLVEFKLWTDRYKVANDVRRLKQICRAVDSAIKVDQSHRMKGYVVVCPQYYQGLASVDFALSDFSGRFPICWSKTEECDVSGRMFGIGSAVIDIDCCDEGAFG